MSYPKHKTNVMSKPRIDEIDRKILDILQENARITNADIARQVNLVPSATLERVRRLEKMKIIKGYHACIDPIKMDYNFLAFVYIKTENRFYTSNPKPFIQYKEIQEVHHVAGEDCFLLKIRTKDTPHFNKFLQQVILKTDGVKETRSVIVMETNKETLSIPVEENLK